jgi:hypothetical protein
MATTTNFGWETPDDTDLVKDGAAAMRTLGNSIDTSFVDLKGGTTGQVLAKASNTDLDYTWTTPQVGDITEVAAGTGISGGGTSGSVTITNSMATAIDAKGDLIAGTGADTFARLAVGTNDYVLTAASGETTGLKWAAVPGGQPTSWTLINTGGTALTGATTITISGINHKQLFILVFDASSANAGSIIFIRPNGDTGANYSVGGTINTVAGSYATTNFYGQASYSGVSSIQLGKTGAASGTLSGALFIDSAATTGWKRWAWDGGGNADGGGSDFQLRSNQGIWEASAAITSIDIISSTGNFDAGTIYVLGAS